MSEKDSDEQKVFEEKLDKAMDEAWSKVNQAFDQTARSSVDFDMSIRLAAEAVEFSSALFSLTYGLEDFDPEVRVKRGEDLSKLLKDSVEALRRARELRPQSVTEAYSSLRTSAESLKRAYLDRVNRSSKRPG